MQTQNKRGAVNRKSDFVTSAVFCLLGLLSAAASFGIAALKGVNVASFGGIFMLGLMAIVFFVMAFVMACSERRLAGPGMTEFHWIWDKAGGVASHDQ